MGIYYRHAAAALILLLCTDTYAATRKSVSHGQTKASVVNGNGASFQTPNGEASFYGQDFVDEHTAGRRFNTGDNPTGKTFPPKPTIPITVKPTVKVNPVAVAKAAADLLKKGGPGAVAIAATAAAQWAIEQIPTATYDPETGQPVIATPQPGQPMTYMPTAQEYGWAVSGDSRRRSTPQAACEVAVPIGTVLLHQYSNPPTNYPVASYLIAGSSETSVTCYLMPANTALGAIQQRTVLRTGTVCPPGGTYSTTLRTCTTTLPATPFSESNYSDLEDALRNVPNSEWMRDLVKKSCEGSPSPSQCYDQLTTFGPLSGPSTQLGPSVSTTSTTTKPDGTTSTTTVSMQNSYTYNYGDNHYNYSVQTTTKTTTDGQTTTTTTTDTPGSEPENDPLDSPHEDFDGEFQDSEFPEVPSFYEQKYPNGLEGVWQQARADIDHSAFMQFLRGFVPSFSGSCPSFGLSFNIASWANYGNIQFSSICYVLDFVKIILLVTALFTFRKVTFGG